MDTFRHEVRVKSPVVVNGVDELVTAVETALDNLVAARNYLLDTKPADPWVSELDRAIAALAGQ